ncbi:MAG TPA: hypothetical protein DCY14_07940, partial [Anaerolineae bacterium]|nr:hypothetical protein [Anaerolineae bacterium]
MNRDRINKLLNRIPTHFIIILMILIWVVPTFGLLITSLRPSQSINTSGWWTILSPPRGSSEYGEYCASCHGDDGTAIPEADLTNPALIAEFPRSLQLLNALKAEYDGQPHMQNIPLPEAQAAADIATYLRRISGVDAPPRFTFSNYIDALVGYRGTSTYQRDCAAGTAPLDINCDASDLLNPRGMGRAFLNSLLVTIPATFIPILFAAFAGYAFAWLDFKGRFLLFAILVGLQVVPLQMTLVPISR